MSGELKQVNIPEVVERKGYMVGLTEEELSVLVEILWAVCFEESMPELDKVEDAEAYGLMERLRVFQRNAPDSLSEKEYLRGRSGSPLPRHQPRPGPQIRVEPEGSGNVVTGKLLNDGSSRD
jgi:hypothetical protein